LVAEFEQRDLPRWAGGAYTVREISEALHQFILAKYEAAYPPPAQLPLPPPEAAADTPAVVATNETPSGNGPPAGDGPIDQPTPPPPDTRIPLGVVMGGYSTGEFFPVEYEMLILVTPAIEVWAADRERGQRYGVRWWGQTRPIERLYLGCDTEAIGWFIDNGVPEQDAVQYYSQLRDRLIWPIIYEGMPLQDAIDLAVYLVNVTIGHSRFAVGPPVCGGRIDVATITPRGFRWIHQKELVVKTDSVFF
jgi:hypothetical protein